MLRLEDLLRTVLAANASVVAPAAANASLEAPSSQQPATSSPSRPSSVPAFGVIGVMSAMCVLAVIFVAYGLFSRAEAMKDEQELADMEMQGALFSLDFDQGGVGGLPSV